MKKLLAILAITLFGINAMAQWGVKGGANFATLKGDNANGLKTLVGFYGGVYYNMVISPKFGFQHEVVYSAQGAKVDDSDNGKFKFDYLLVSPLFRYNSNGFFAGTGPVLGFLLSAKLKDGSTNVDFKDEVKSTDFLWAFLVGYTIPSGFGFSGRYNLGLANIAEAGELKNSVFSVGLRYDLDNKRK